MYPDEGQMITYVLFRDTLHCECTVSVSRMQEMASHSSKLYSVGEGVGCGSSGSFQLISSLAPLSPHPPPPLAPPSPNKLSNLPMHMHMASSFSTNLYKLIRHLLGKHNNIFNSSDQKLYVIFYTPVGDGSYYVMPSVRPSVLPLTYHVHSISSKPFERLF